MITLKTPGVYIREVEVRPPRFVRLGVTALVGAPPRGPVHTPQLVTSWGQYREIFDGFTGSSYLPYAVFAFFLNGGERCYIVRAIHETATPGTRTIRADALDVLRFDAANPGAWSDSLSVKMERSPSPPMVLTSLAAAAADGTKTLELLSVDGLAAGDEVTVVDPGNPLSRRTYSVTQVAAAERKLTVVEETPDVYPPGARVLARGLRFTFEYVREGRAARTEVFDNVTMIPSHERYVVRAINGDPEERDEQARIDKGQSILVRVKDLRIGATARPRPDAGEWGFEGGHDAAEDTPRGLSSRYYTGYEWPAYYLPVPSKPEVHAGLAATEAVEEIGTVAIPDLMLPDLYEFAKDEVPDEGIIFTQAPEKGIPAPQLRQGQRDMIEHARKLGDRFAILDSPLGSRPSEGENPTGDWAEQYRQMPGAKNAALYCPWIRHRAADFEERDLLVPPSGHVAGMWAGIESRRGPGKTPANALVEGAIDLEFCLADLAQESLNEGGVNCLRAFPGRGLRVWGGRTLSTDPAWTYLNMRRLYHFIVKSILLNLRWIAFEPNTPALWTRATATLKPLFDELFRQGAFAGATPKESFFLLCDESTNTPETIERGQMIMRLGFAPAEPAEFIVVTIRRMAESFTVTEAR